MRTVSARALTLLVVGGVLAATPAALASIGGDGYRSSTPSLAQIIERVDVQRFAHPRTLPIIPLSHSTELGSLASLAIPASVKHAPSINTP